MPHCRRIADALCVVLAAAIGLASPATAAMPENLAAKAKTSATSEHNRSYLSRFAVDGKIAAAGSQGADIAAAWCVLKAMSGDKADFTFEWKQPVEAAEVRPFRVWRLDRVNDSRSYCRPQRRSLVRFGNDALVSEDWSRTDRLRLRRLGNTGNGENDVPPIRLIALRTGKRHVP